jgi:hypothetical protein
MGFEERRQFPRFPCRFPASAEGPRGPVRGHCTDLSVGGLFIEGITLSKDSLTTVKIEFPSGPVSFQAQVRRVITEGNKGTGLQFMRLEPQQLVVLQRFAKS